MSTPVIQFRELSYSYGKGKLRRQVLFDLTGQISAGEIVIVKGPSGSGKTTLLSLLGALREVQHGQVNILNHRLNDASMDEKLQVRRKIGFVFQLHNLIDALTATENIMMALRLHPDVERPIQVAHQTLAAVGLQHAFELFPHQLSGGERQRVAIARAMVSRPKIVLADEPTASLDGATGYTIVKILRDLANEQGIAVLLVTHDARILDIADRILTLQDGRFVSESSDA